MPDEIRQEKINIGVVLHCPDKRIILTRFLNNLQKLNKFLTKNQVIEYRAFKNKLNRHFKNNRDSILDLLPDIAISPIDFDYLDKLSEVNFNKFYLFNITPLITEDPYVEINNLFNIYVHNEDQIQREKPLVNEVWRRFKEAGIEKYIRKDIEIPNFPVNIDYGFQNGQLNLMQTIKFTDNLKDNFKEGLMWKDAIEIKQHTELKKSPFYAIVKPPSDPQKYGYELAINQFKSFQYVKIIEYGTRHFNGLINHIKEYGHILN
jgi:hypothetical protein